VHHPALEFRVPVGPGKAELDREASEAVSSGPALVARGQAPEFTEQVAEVATALPAEAQALKAAPAAAVGGSSAAQVMEAAHRAQPRALVQALALPAVEPAAPTTRAVFRLGAPRTRTSSEF